jgi:ABC-2 type transport system permease protein
VVAGSTVTGTWTLVRFILRRDRVRLPVWILGLAALVLFTAISVKGFYPTQADLDAAAAPMRDNAAVIALNGPPYGIDTIGGQIVFQVGSFGYVAVAMMGMFLVGRHTRADEESGRTELVRAAAVGRNAPVTAVILVAAGAFAVLGALITLIMLGQDVPATGSFVFGAAMGAFGLFFACVTTVTVQVSAHNRAALGLAGVLLGASYVVRAVGDVGGGTLSWLSPMGWAQSARPYAGEQPWTVGLLLTVSAVLVGVAFALQASRDLGAGLVSPRPGRAGASAGLLRPAGLAFRLQRASILAWAVGLALTGVAYGSVVEDVADLIGDNDAFADLIAQLGGDLTDSFLATSLLTMALITGGFAVASTLRLRGEEAAGRAEPLLATTMSRGNWAISHLVMAMGGSVVILLAAAAGLGLTAGVISGDLGDFGVLLAAALTFAPALWVLVGLTFALFGLAPEWVTLAWGALVAFLVIGFFGQLFELPGWVVDLSPFQHVPQAPAQDFALGPVLVLTLVAAVLVAAGYVGFNRRDLTS